MPHIGRKTIDECWVSCHLSVGAAILLFIVLKLIWRLIYPFRLVPTMPVWQQRFASATHWLVYLVILVMGLLGCVAANFRGWDVRPLGVVTLPAIATKGARWPHTAGDVHDWLLYVLAGVIGVHVFGELYHHYFQRDEILQRMLPTSD
jgi:cytochrome b561